MNYLLLIYFFTTSFISAMIFYTDKKNAIKNKKRIPEKTLHLLELSGGVFVILILSYIIRHKNQKKSYISWTYLIFVLWIVILYFLVFRFNIF